MMQETSERRKGRILAMLANTLNALEMEIDRPDGIGVDGERLGDLDLAASALVTPLILGEATQDFMTAYDEYYDGDLVTEVSA